MKYIKHECQLIERCDGHAHWEGVREKNIFLNSHFPNIISAILSFSKLLQENPRIHADSRNPKNTQGYLHGLLDFLVKAMVLAACIFKNIHEIPEYSGGQYKQAISS